jgi:hypothetical protein
MSSTLNVWNVVGAIQHILESQDPNNYYQCMLVRSAPTTFHTVGVDDFFSVN